MAKKAVRARSLQVAAGDAPKPRIRLGVILAIGDPPQPVPITADDIANAAANGVEFTLQQPIVLGSVNNLIAWMSTKFSIPKLDPATLPPPLDTVVGKITGIVVTVEKLHLKIPGKNDPAGTAGTLYTIEANGMFDSPIDVFGLFSINGFVFGFSNEPVKTPPTP